MSEQSPKVHRIENRSGLFNAAGHTISVMLVMAFAITLGTSVFQLDFWQTYFFRGTVPIGDRASVAAWMSDSAEVSPAPPDALFAPIAIPHWPNNTLQELITGNGTIPHAHYQFNMDTPLLEVAGVAYLHLGWVLARHTDVLVNGTPRASFDGIDKPVIPLTTGDIAAPRLRIDVLAVGNERQTRFGFAGGQPPVLAAGNMVNARIMGVETALQNIRGLSSFLPLITLALVIIFGWYSGIRVRPMLTALFYFAYAALAALNLINADILAVSIPVTYMVDLPLRIGTSIAFVLFVMEIVKVWPRSIYRWMIVTVLSTVGYIVVGFTNPLFHTNNQATISTIYTFLMVLILAYMAWRSWRASKAQTGQLAAYRNVSLALVPLLLLMVGCFALDMAFYRMGIWIVPSRHLDLLLPLFCGGILLYSLSLTDKRFQEERARTETLKTEMLLERARTDVLSSFLSQHLVAKFSDQRALSQSLSSVLTPRSENILVFQADIRGFTRITSQMDGIEMVRLLQLYYRPIVDVAQVIGQVKLIGDCVFIFVEQSACPNQSLGDIGVELAALLARETAKLNAQAATTGRPEIRFGIAIHCGPAIVGNLSSNLCIDYTALGTNVNFVARLEELTKHPSVRERVGDNGVLLSPQIAAALRQHGKLPIKDLDMRSIDGRVRSFESVPTVHYLTLEDLRKLGVDNLPAPSTGSKIDSKAPALI